MSQGACMNQDQEQVLDSEFGLIEMTEVEYSQLQHFIQAQMEAQGGPETRLYSATAMVKEATGSAVISPNSSTQAIDLSVSGDDHCLLLQGEKTPLSYSDVPGFVLARISGVESPVTPPATGRTSSQRRSKPAARVCLEKRFNCICSESTRQQDSHPTVINNLLAVLHESAEGQETVTHPQKLKWMKADRADSLEVPNSFIGGVFDPVTNMYGQVVAHMVEPSIHQGFIYPKGFSYNFHHESHLTKTLLTESGHSRAEEELIKTGSVYRNHYSSLFSQPTKDAKAAPDVVRQSRSGGWKRARSGLSVSQRKERHNSKERERRMKIRLYCDELNTMVPFCDSSTDKVTTLQWTLSFLRYISIMYGDALKDDFKKFFTTEKGMFLMSTSSSDHLPFHLETDKSASAPLAAEQ